MTGFAKISHFFSHELWSIDPASVPLLQRIGIHALRLAIAVAMQFSRRLLDARAAGLVYTTLLSLVPFLAVMFSVLKAFGVHQHIEPLLAQALAPLGPKGQEITTTIIGFVDNLQIGVLGIVGVAGLFYTAFSLIDKIEESLNAIWLVREGRSLGRKFADYLSTVLVGPLLVVTALGILASLHSQALVQYILNIQPFGYLIVWAGQLLPFLLMTGLFTFLYSFIPHTLVRFDSALVGGATAALLWSIAGKAFAAFVTGSASYSAIYSGFAILIIFLLWLYVGWLIVLIGAQFSFFYQHPSAYLSQVLWQRRTTAFRERLLLKLLVVLAQRHVAGLGPINLDALAAELRLPDSIVEEQVDTLTDGGWIGEMAQPQGLVLAKPPELISIYAVLNQDYHGSLEGQAVFPDPSDPIHDVLQRRDQAVEQALTGVTLRSLVEEGVKRET